MSYQFKNIPGNLRVPGVYAEFQPGGTPYVKPARLLLVGQKLAAGTATANVPVGPLRDGQEDGLAGAGAMLAQMYRSARRQAPVQEIWFLPLDDAGAGVAATGKITIANAASITSSTAYVIYIAGRRVRFAVLSSDTDAQICANLVGAINADPDMPVTAAVNGTNDYECDLTAKHKGYAGNEIQIDFGPINFESPDTSTLTTITAMSGGQQDPDVTAALDALGEEEFDWIAHPYWQADNVGKFSDLMNDVSGRWSWAQQIYGHVIGVHPGTLATLSTFGNGYNDQHLTFFPCYKFVSTPWEVAAAVGAVAARDLQTPPLLSASLATADLNGIDGPRLKADRFSKADRQVLYYDGMSGYTVERDGTVSLDMLVTTYQLNEFGSADATYLKIQTMAQSMFGWRYLKQKIENTHARQALVDDENRQPAPGQVRPKDIKLTFIHGYQELATLGVYERVDLFARDVSVTRDILNADRVNAIAPVDHVNQLEIVASVIVNHMQRAQPRTAA